MNLQMSNEKWKKIILGFISIIFIIINIYLIFDNVFWTDEVISIDFANQSFGNMIKITALDVHPPLYYIFLKVGCSILGYHGWVYHLVSVIPFIIIVILINTSFQKAFGTMTSALLLVMCGGSYVGATYNVEVRMYSWAICFTLLCFFYTYKIQQNNKWKDWIVFTIFAIASAYVHYFALLTVFFMAFVLYLIQIIKFGKKVLPKIICSIFMAIVGYLPWIKILLKSISNVASDYWITSYPNVKSCLKWSFGETIISFKMAFATYLLVLLWLITKYIITKKCIKKESLKEKIKWKDNGMSAIDYTLLVGIFTITMTILCGIVVSELLRPVLQLRYLSQLIGIAAICFGIIITKYIDFFITIDYVRFGIKSLLVVFVVFFFMKSGYQEVLMKFVKQRQDTVSTIEYLDENQVTAGYNLVLQGGLVFRYYYPEASIEKYNEEHLAQAMEEQQYISLFVEAETLTQELIEQIQANNFEMTIYNEQHLAEENYTIAVLKKRK